MAQVISEYRKLVTWRAWWFLAVTMVLATTGLTAVATLGAVVAPRSNIDVSAAESASLLYTLTAVVGPVFPLALGVIVVTREHSHGTATLAFLAEPRRGRVLWAKVALAAGASLVLGLVTVAISSAAAASLLASNGASTFLSAPAVTERLAGTVAALVGWGVIGVGLGALVRNQVVAIVGVIAFTQFVEPIVRMVALNSSVPHVAEYLPGGANEALAGGTLISAALGGAPQGPAHGGLVLVGYAVVLLLAGQYRMTSTDVL